MVENSKEIIREIMANSPLREELKRLCKFDDRTLVEALEHAISNGWIVCKQS